METPLTVTLNLFNKTLPQKAKPIFVGNYSVIEALVEIYFNENPSPSTRNIGQS